MHLTLEQAAAELGKTPRQVRYLIKTGKLAAQAAASGWLEAHRRLALKDPSVHVHQTREPCTVLGFRLGASVRPGKKMERRLRGKVRAAAARGPSALARTVRSYRALWQFG